MTEEYDNRQEMWRLYKLHVQISDCVSQRREGANRRYAGLLSGVAVFSFGVLRFKGNEIEDWFIGMLGFLGFLLACSWIIVICVYHELTSAKLKIISEIEEEFSWHFYIKERNILKGNGHVESFHKLKMAEMFSPIIFLVFFLVILSHGLCDIIYIFLHALMHILAHAYVL